MGEILELSELPEAVQIINIENHTLKLDKETIVRILEADDIKDREVVVVSIAGSLRKGKSFLLNFFLKYLNAQYKKHDVTDWIGKNEGNNELEGFKWRGGKDRETVGIWMWSEIFTYDYKNGDGVAIILMDTQGIFDNESSLKDCISIFAISMLLSSVQCYNIMRGVQEDDIQHLELFMAYAKLAMDDDVTSEKPFQRLLFIVRDWPFPYDNDYGYSPEYIIEYLTENEKQTTEMRQLRENIKLSFDDVNAFLLPHPGKAVTQQKDFNGNLKQIDPEFVDHVEDLAESIFDPENLLRKRMNDENVRAHEFVKYLETYFHAFEGNDLPTPQTILMATAEVQIRMIHDKCVDIYVKMMQGALDDIEGYFEEREFDQEHDLAKRHSMRMFHGKKKLGGILLISEWEDKLQISIREKHRRFSKINKTRKDGIESNKSKILRWIAGSSAVIAGGATIAVAGPIGYGLFLSEASTLVLSAVAAGSTVGGASIGASITSLVNKFLPAKWFRNRSIESSVDEVGTDAANESVGSVATENTVGETIKRHAATVKNALFGFFRRW